MMMRSLSALAALGLVALTKASTLICAEDTISCGNVTLSRYGSINCYFPACPSFAPQCERDVQYCTGWTNGYVSRDPTKNCAFPTCRTGCEMDTRTCGDKTVYRDWRLNCDFPACPETCPQEEKECPGGAYVRANPYESCNFPACPTIQCARDTIECNGEQLKRDLSLNCEHPYCAPAVVDCGGEPFECPSGELIYREADLDCEYPECTDQICTKDMQQCSDGSSVGRDATKDCEFRDCPETATCPDDKRTCADGTVVSRVLENKCNYAACPALNSITKCPADVKTCSDGKQVVRNPGNKCEFHACPTDSGNQNNDSSSYVTVAPCMVSLATILLVCVLQQL